MSIEKICGTCKWWGGSKHDMLKIKECQIKLSFLLMEESCVGHSSFADVERQKKLMTAVRKLMRDFRCGTNAEVSESVAVVEALLKEKP